MAKNKLKYLTIVGARPQFIKSSIISKTIEEKYPNISEILVHTGQHFDDNMSKIFFDEFNLKYPKYNLGISSGTHGQNTGRMIESIEQVLLQEKPDFVILYGDTDSTLAGAISASKLNIKIAHIEAGLRSFNKQMPEEINRIIVDHVSSYLFTPTITASNNLLNEGISDSIIFNVGDIMYDIYLSNIQKQTKPKSIEKNLDFCLLTLHRANLAKDFNILYTIIDAINEISKSTNIVWPVHPSIKSKIKTNYLHTNIRIIDPVSYFEMLWLLNNSQLVLTDSGGLQKEAFFSQKNTLIFREETEWVEILINSDSLLVGSDFKKIIDGFNSLINKKFTSKSSNIYGCGNASNLIIQTLM